MFKTPIIVFIIIASLGMFNLAALGPSVIKVLELAGIGVIAAVILLQFVYTKEDGFDKRFKVEVSIILISVFLSMFMAYSGHNQGFSTTIIAQRFMYFYLFYFALHLIRIPDYDLEKIIVYLAIVHVLFYMIQFASYPARVFDVRTSDERGTLRIFLPGLSYLVLGYFYMLNKIFERFTPGKLALLFFFFSIFILMGTRQILFSTFLLTMLYILLSKRVKSKILILVIAALSVVPVIFMFQDIFLSLLDVSQQQSEGFAEDIRVRAATFFILELFPNNLSYLTGNGADSANSPYGQAIQMYRDVYGFYQSDVGIIGDFTKFGALYVLAVFVLIFRMIFSKTGDDYSYIKYYYINILLTLFTGGSPFGEADSIVAIGMTMYIMDVDKHKRKLLEEEDDIPGEIYDGDGEDYRVTTTQT